MVVQTGPVLSNIPGKLPGAVRELQRQADCFHNGMGNAPAAIGPIVARAVIRYFAYQSDPGIFLFHIQSEVRIPLVILEKDIVLWQVAFDQRAFQNKGFKFTGCDNNIKMMDFRHHHLRLRRVGCCILKILTDPVFQFFCLAHIDDLIVFVPHDIDARRIR